MKNNYRWLLLIFLLSICSENAYSINFQELDSIPIINTLKRLYEWDQKDRQYLIDTASINNGLTDINDSIRLSKVLEIDKKGLLQTNLEKYYAAFIYLHAGGSKMKEDSIYYVRSIDLCREILNSKIDEEISDTISLQNLRQNKTFQIFSNLLSKQKEIKLDTMIRINDTLIIVNQHIKFLAKTLMNLSESALMSLKESKGESINLNDLDNPDSLKVIRQNLRRKIISNLQAKQPLMLKSMTEEQIDQLVDETLQNLINYRKGLIEDIKKNPEKYDLNKNK